MRGELSIICNLSIGILFATLCTYNNFFTSSLRILDFLYLTDVVSIVAKHWPSL